MSGGREQGEWTIDPDKVFPSGAGSQPYRILDVRSPGEAARGALPCSRNIAILDDDERHQVGIRYKESGQEAAVELGYGLTEPHMSSRVNAWRSYAAEAPTVVACWRGGMRSELAQRFMSPIEIARVSGGYKALRAHLLNGIAVELQRFRPLVITGMTGSGKTELIASLAEQPGVLALDLEGHAAHRGSAFGANGEQPAQQTFENSLAAEITLSPAGLLIMEDESRRIGNLQLPAEIWEVICRSQTLVLEAPQSERLARIHEEYVVAPAMRTGVDRTLDSLSEATRRLQRRLGADLTGRLEAVLESARQGDGWRDLELMARFIEPLLSEYYDPLYRKAVAKLPRPVYARGDREELQACLTRMA